MSSFSGRKIPSRRYETMQNKAQRENPKTSTVQQNKNDYLEMIDSQVTPCAKRKMDQGSTGNSCKKSNLHSVDVNGREDTLSTSLPLQNKEKISKPTNMVETLAVPLLNDYVRAQRKDIESIFNNLKSKVEFLEGRIPEQMDMLHQIETKIMIAIQNRCTT